MPRSRGLLAKVTASVVALAALVAAMGKLVDASSPLGPYVQPIFCKIGIGCSASDVSTAATLVGKTGWIYVGTRIDEKWETSAQEGQEPALTTEETSVPAPSQTRTIKTPVYLRVEAPAVQKDGSRPSMPDSLGSLAPGTTVKVDNVKQIELKQPTRTWIWAHVTVAG